MGEPRELPPGEVARVEQFTAELRDIVAQAAGHAERCTTLPAGLCIGEAATIAIRRLACARRLVLLEEAVAQLAAARTQP